MKSKGINSATGWLGGALAIVIAVAAGFYYLNQRAPDLPQVDLALMEPRVATRIRQYSSAVQADHGSGEAWAGLAQVFHAHELFPQALAAYEEAMALQPGDSRWPYLAALAQAKSDPEAAVPLFRKAVDLKPANAAVYINFGDILMRLGLADEARAAHRQALTVNPDSTHALYGLAQAEMQAGNVASATELLESAEAIAPQHGEVHTLLAQVYQRQGNEAAARRQSLLAAAWPASTRAPDPVVRAMEALAVDSQSLARQGVILAKRGAFAEAEAAFREVLSIRDGSARDHANLGGALAGQGRLEEALAAYRQGLEIEPEDVDSLNNLGYTLIRLRRYEEAQRQLQRALEIEPGFAPAWGNLGLLMQQTNERQQAIDHYRRALEHDSGLLFARQSMAVLLAERGEAEAAIEQWRIILEINPRELSALYNLARTQAALGEYAEAIRLLRSGLAFAPNSSRLVAALAWELATTPADDLRDGAQALQLAQRVYQAFPDQPDFLDITAAALAETGDFDNAVKLMEQAIELGGDADMMLHLKAYRQGRPWRQVPTPGIRASVLEPVP